MILGCRFNCSLDNLSYYLWTFENDEEALLTLDICDDNGYYD